MGAGLLRSLLEPRFPGSLSIAQACAPTLAPEPLTKPSW